MALTEKEKYRRKSIASRIKIARRCVGFSDTRSFASKYFPNIPEDSFYKWESGKSFPDDEILKQIGKHTQISFNWLKTGDGDMFEGVEIVDPTEAENKAAIAGYEILSLHFNYQVKEVSITPLKHMLAQYGRANDLENSSTANKTLNSNLLELILESLIASLHRKKISINPKRLAKLSVEIYKKTSEISTDEKIQKQMIDLVVETVEWFSSSSETGD